MKRVIIVHGWGGSPNQDWLQWLKSELESREFKVEVPEMPDTMKPKIEVWVSKLSEVVGTPDKDTYLVGHSIGCQTVLRYIQTLPEGAKVGGAVCVAGWFNLTDETWDEEYNHEIGDPWIETPMDYEKIKSHTDKIVDIVSDNDPYVPLSDTDIFKEKLGAKVIIIKEQGHISGEDGVTELPIALEELLRMSQNN